MAKVKSLLEETQKEPLIDYNGIAEQLITNSIKGNPNAITNIIYHNVLAESRVLFFDWIKLEQEMYKKAHEMQVDFGLISDIINSLNSTVSTIITRKLVVPEEIPEDCDDDTFYDNAFSRTLGGVILDASVKDVKSFIDTELLQEKLRLQIEKQMNLLSPSQLEISGSLCVLPSFLLSQISFSEINNALETEDLSVFNRKNETKHMLQNLPNISENSRLPWVVLFIVKDKNPNSLRDFDNPGVVQNPMVSWVLGDLDDDFRDIWVEKCNVIEEESDWEKYGLEWSFRIPDNFEDCCLEAVVSEVAFLSEYVFKNEKVQQKTNVGLRLHYSNYNSNYEIVWSLRNAKEKDGEETKEFAKIKIPHSFNKWVSKNLIHEIIREGASRGFASAEMDFNDKVGEDSYMEEEPKENFIDFKISDKLKKDKYRIN